MGVSRSLWLRQVELTKELNGGDGEEVVRRGVVARLDEAEVTPWAREGLGGDGIRSF